MNLNFNLAQLQFSHMASILMSLLVGGGIIAMRLRAANRPVSLRKIIIPPLAMSTGFLMFAVPDTRVPWLWALYAFAAGAILFAYPLIRTSRLERQGGEVVLKRSKTFIVILLALFIIRLLLHDVLEQVVSIPQTAGLFFILAFGMILVWRLAMLRIFLRLANQPG
ncbi:CcdC family protein [Paenibacillus methanolicus]|uniref:Membrane protein CcdC involved in cytochrome C biogenesis n=1 Tax=Paenibacillus methanolicus TaxID=582686 RepID=A0A5S5C8Q1_9BACL|nr:cytochrome c biogenesis protein CcdC [Paenibacillus methanolicus]TYP75559.1 membrane protein CcdC involved in cytochrome C biogenesis [Paenibacillus methanolicus]